MAEDLILNEDVNTVNSYCNIGINTFEEQTNLYEETMDDLGRKRIRDEENGGEWQQVVSHTKKKTKIMDSSESDFIQVCITGKNMLPKAFTLAKLFREQKILDVIKVKYINPYKINVSFSNESSAEKLIACEEFIKLEWRFQKSWEVGLSFGIIRNIDTELSEEEIIKNISCDFEIVVVKRLNRRFEKEWIPSDTVKIGFKDTQIVNSTPSAKDYVYMPQCTIDASPSYSEVLRMPQENHKADSPSQNVKKPSAKKKKKRVQISENVYADFSTDSDIDLENENKTPFTTSEEENKQREEYQKMRLRTNSSLSLKYAIFHILDLFLDPIGLLNSLELWLSAELLLEIFDAIPHLEI
ncbi:unnamed protein product, partial [Brenthis ino]